MNEVHIATLLPRNWTHNTDVPWTAKSYGEWALSVTWIVTVMIGRAYRNINMTSAMLDQLIFPM